MLEQVHSLDLLYERETTSKLLEFKLKYLVSYATLMSNYFVHMNIEDIVNELVSLEDGRGKLLVLFAANIVGPQVQSYPKAIDEVTPDHLTAAQQFMLTPEFATKFKSICEMSTLPEISLAEMKVLKKDLIDHVVTPTLADELGNAARLLSSWLDGILEFTILKHEVIVLRLKNNKVLDQIKAISKLWPKKKSFIEGAYKVLLFTRTSRRQLHYAVQLFKQPTNPHVAAFVEFMDYHVALTKVVRKWYEQRIQEETAQNDKLKTLHQQLTTLMLLKQK